MTSPRIQRALISVSDKTGLTPFAEGLAAAGVEIFSTGGTRKHLEAAGLKVQDIATYTGFPEMMHGRLKTLHPKVFGGILCRHDLPEDMDALREHGISTFELVVVNLYPFQATIAKAGVTLAEAIEQIDIGGPSLVRAAGKNHAFTTIVTAADQYDRVLEQLKEQGATTLDLRFELAAAAFEHTARYDRGIADYLAGHRAEGAFPASLSLNFQRKQVLRYGENPHQQAAFYVEPGTHRATLATAEQLNGKELSYNNLLDLDSALAIVRTLGSPAAVVVKHNNPCGAAAAESPAKAFLAAYEGDPLSAFGGIVGFNRMVDAEAAEAMAEPGRFIEAIVAPDFSPEAVQILTTKPKWKNSVRLVKVGEFSGVGAGWDYRRIDGGLLVQDRDLGIDDEAAWKVASNRLPTLAEMEDMKFGWALVRHVKSNAIVLARQQSLVGVGAGQMSRVDSVEISIKKAGELARGSVLASDAFFPFPDSIHFAAAAGVTAVIQPGGSKQDPEVIAACNQHGMAMVITGQRHFKH